MLVGHGLGTSAGAATAAMWLGLASGCYSGVAGDPAASGSGGADAGDDGGDDDGASPVPPETAEMVGENGLRRLTAAEYSATVRDLLGVDVDAELLLPEDWRRPFDNDATSQIASQALIEGAELLASDVASLALATPAGRAATVGCEPSGPTDEACFRQFIETFGRRALRRPLSASEADRFAELISEAVETGDFYAAVDVALRAFLQHPLFLYRVELGAPVQNEDGVYRLTEWELASRLSYLIWGSTPSDTILDLAASGDLSDAQQVAAAAEEMLLDDRARARISRFHSMWLGYEQLPHAPELADAMQVETNALLERVLFDDSGAWQDLLSAEETFIDGTLAAHYGLPDPGAPGWVDYGDTERRGLLSHGSFLSAFAKIDDSSPTQRGILVRTRLMCQVVLPPPPEVDVDNTEIPEGACKDDFYRELHASGGCAGCHDQFDPIGLGLENYDHRGAFRTVETENPECVIPGDGEVDGVPFSGPSALADVLMESGTVDRCVAQQLYRFAVGRSELTVFDMNFVDHLVQDLQDGELNFNATVLRFVGSDAFLYRRDEAEGGN